MFVLFFLLFFASLVTCVIGLIKPTTVVRWGKIKSRAQVLKVYGLSMLLTFILSVATAPPSQPTNATPALSNAVVTNTKTTSATTTTEATTQSSELAPAITPTAVETTKVVDGQKLKVSYIDVGQADSILIQIPNGKNVLIDAGNNGDAGTIVTYLRSQGVNRLDVVIGTHPHEDHIGSLDTVITQFDIGQVVMPKVTSNTQTYKDVLTAIADNGLKITQAKAGLTLDLGPEVSATLLAPNSSSYEDLNDYSAVLRLVYGKTVFLFDGDASAQSESEMLNAGYDLKADVLKVGHHGSSSATTPAFLAKVNPKYAVISVGKNNSYGHPTKETLNKLSGAGVKVYRTDQDGTIVAESDGTTITFRTIATSVQANAPPTSTVAKSSSSSSNTAVKAAPPVVSKPSSSKNVIVYITRTGKKYHVDGCRYLSRSKIAISLQEAKAEGYTPCSVCDPPQ